MNMTIYSYNYLNTTTMLKTDPTQTSGWTSTSGQIFDRKDNKYVEVSNLTSATYASLYFTMTSSINIDAIVIKNFTSTNLSRLLFTTYAGSTYTNFSLSGCNTTSSHWTTNIPTGDLFLKLSSQTAITSYILFRFYPSVTATACTIKMSDVYLLQKKHTFTDNPDSVGYSPKLDRTEYKHTMSDGGISTYVIQDNFSCELKGKYLSSTDKNTLKTIYQLQEPLYFTPFPTGTSWNGEIWEVNWLDDFDFKFSDSYTGNGYDYKIKLQETPK